MFTPPVSNPRLPVDLVITVVFLYHLCRLRPEPFLSVFLSFCVHFLSTPLIRPQKRTSRPPSFIGDSPITLRSRSSTCDSIKSGTSPTISVNSTSSNRQISVGYGHGLGTSPKQQMSFPQYGAQAGGASSPSSITSRSTHSVASNQSRKSAASKSFVDLFGKREKLFNFF